MIGKLYVCYMKADTLINAENAIQMIAENKAELFKLMIDYVTSNKLSRDIFISCHEINDHSFEIVFECTYNKRTRHILVEYVCTGINVDDTIVFTVPCYFDRCNEPKCVSKVLNLQSIRDINLPCS